MAGQTTRRLIDSRAEVVAALQRHDGGIHDPNGRVNGILAAELGRKPETLTSLLKAMENDGVIVRDVDVANRRTYEIIIGDVPTDVLERAAELAPVLFPEEVGDPIVAGIVDKLYTPEADPVLEVEPQAGPPDEDVEVDADAVATAILRKVSTLLDLDVDNLVPAERMEAAITARNEFSERLSVTLEETTRLRTRLRDVQDELVATKAERDRLRRDVHQLEDNVKMMARNNNSVVSSEVRDGIARFMRERPMTKGGDT